MFQQFVADSRALLDGSCKYTNTIHILYMHMSVEAYISLYILYRFPHGIHGKACRPFKTSCVGGIQSCRGFGGVLHDHKT